MPSWTDKAEKTQPLPPNLAARNYPEPKPLPEPRPLAELGAGGYLNLALEGLASRTRLVFRFLLWVLTRGWQPVLRRPLSSWLNFRRRTSDRDRCICHQGPR